MPRTNVAIDWWTKIYNADVMRLERMTYGIGARDENTFLDMLSSETVVGQVALKGDAVVGFMVYDLLHRGIKILALVVHPKWRRQGIATQLIDKLKQKLGQDSRRPKTHILCDVPERNLIMQKALRSCGFKAILGENDPDLDCENTFLMVYSSSKAVDVAKICQNETWDS